jgi:hypothetical protein
LNVEKPDFADKKTWKAYLVLEAVAKERNYREMGTIYAINLIGGSLGLTNRTSTTVRDVLYRLARPPYEWIEIPLGVSQIVVKPLDKVLRNSKGGVK